MRTRAQVERKTAKFSQIDTPKKLKIETQIEFNAPNSINENSLATLKTLSKCVLFALSAAVRLKLTFAFDNLQRSACL